MGFDRVDRIHLKLGEEFKKLIKIKIPFSYREMLIHFSMIIVEVNLCHVFPEGFDPQEKRGFAEDMMMAGIETESKMGRVDLFQKGL